MLKFMDWEPTTDGDERERQVQAEAIQRHRHQKAHASVGESRNVRRVLYCVSGQSDFCPGRTQRRSVGLRRVQREREFVKTFSTETKPKVLLGRGGPSEAGWHSIEDFLRCPKEYQFRHIRKIRTPISQVPDHFAQGLMFHAGRARWFALRFATSEKAWMSIKEATEREAEEQKLPVSLKAKQQVQALLTMYVDNYSRRPLPNPIAAEYKLGPAPMKDGDPFQLWRTARLDDVSHYPEAAGKLCIGESKTTSTSINDCLNQYQLHGQPLLQQVLWRNAQQGQAKFGAVAGIMLDIVKKPYGKDRAQFARVFVPVSDWTVKWYVRSMQGYLRAAAAVSWDADAPRNVSACTRLIGRGRIPCEFRDLCQEGGSASSKYVLASGNSLKSHQPDVGMEKMPWE
jgi:hypothetical protein